MGFSDIPSLMEWYFYFVKVLLQTMFEVILYLPLTVRSTIPLGASQIKLRSNTTCHKQI